LGNLCAPIELRMPSHRMHNHSGPRRPHALKSPRRATPQTAPAPHTTVPLRHGSPDHTTAPPKRHRPAPNLSKLQEPGHPDTDRRTTEHRTTTATHDGAEEESQQPKQPPQTRTPSRPDHQGRTKPPHPLRDGSPPRVEAHAGASLRQAIEVAILGAPPCQPTSYGERPRARAGTHATTKPQTSAEHPDTNL